MKTSSRLLAALFFICVSAVAKADTCNGITNNLVQNCGFEMGTFAGYTGTSTTNNLSGIDMGDPLINGAGLTKALTRRTWEVSTRQTS